MTNRKGSMWDGVCTKCGKRNPAPGNKCRWCGEEPAGDRACCNNCTHAQNVDFDQTETLVCDIDDKRVELGELCRRYHSTYIEHLWSKDINNTPIQE